MQLKQTPPGQSRRVAGRATTACLACAGVLSTVAVRAAAPASTQAYSVALKLDGADAGPTPTLLVKEGEDAKVSWGQASAPKLAQLRVTGAVQDAVLLKVKITRASGEVTEPTLLLKLGQPGAVAVGEAGTPGAINIGLTVNRARTGTSMAPTGT